MRIFSILVILLSPILLISQQVMDLSSWNSNFKVTGANAYDSFGKSISTGDINGDGIDDLLTGAPNSDPLGRNSAGTCYVIFGEDYLPQESELELSSDSADIQIYGALSNDKIGYETFVADLNNDNFADIIIGAPFAAVNDNDAAGKVYVIFGGSNLYSSYDLYNEEYSLVVVGDQVNDNLGISLTAGNINGDDYSDLIFSATGADNNSTLNSGKTYVIFGSSNLQSVYNIALNEVDLTFLGENYNDLCGENLQITDYNNDDIHDLIITAPRHNSNNISNSGKIYLVSGSTTFPNNTIDLSDTGNVDVQILGGAGEAYLGRSIASGDVNFDGYDDIVFTNFSSNGAVKIIFGSNSLPTILDMSSFNADVQITGPDFDSIFGDELFVGNLNSDLNSDIIIGIPNANTSNGNSSGIAMVVYGSISLEQQIDLNDRSADLTVFGNSSNDLLASDFKLLNLNGDDKTDFAVSALEAANNKGVIYNIFGDLPFVTERDPQPESIDNSVDQIVYFKLIDHEDGIDLSTLNVIIGGTHYNSADPNLSYSGNENEYQITIIPDIPFGYDQEIDVTIDCDDLVGWHINTDIYRFYTIADIEAPFTDLWNPVPGSLDASVDTNISFHVYDLGEGVDINSINVTIQGEDYYLGQSGFGYSGTSHNYEIAIDPDNNFGYGDEVIVSIDAADMAEPANSMSTFDFSFTCGSDFTNPFVYSWDPSFNQEVSFNYPINIEVRDLESGIDMTSIDLLLDDISIIDSSSITSNTEDNGYIVHYTPSAGNYYAYGTHALEILCSDNAASPNSIQANSEFVCIQDIEPPITDNHFPDRFAANVATNTHILVDILDDFTGVDINSISILLDGAEIIGSQGTTINNIANGYQIIHIPEQRLQGTVNVEINVDDMSIPANSMLPDMYSFECEIDEEPPYLINADPADGSQDVPVGQAVYLELRDSMTGIDQSSIQMEIEQEDVTSQTVINPISNGFSLFYVPAPSFSYGAQVDVDVSCSDLAIDPNPMNQSYAFLVEYDEDAPYIQNEEPGAGEIAVPLDTNIYFEVIDSGVGVDENSIQLFVDGSLVDPVLTATQNGSGFEVVYDPTLNFEYSSIVNISITAADLAEPANSITNYSYSFSCVDDDEDDPFLRGINPAPDANNVSIDTSVSFEVLDATTGIDQNSIIFKVNNETLSAVEYDLTAVSYGDTLGFSILYKPEIDFQYGEIVFIQFFATDNSSNSNEVWEEYSFACDTDEIAPEIVEYYPKADSLGFPNTTLYYYFVDEKAGIDSASFVFSIDDVQITDYQVVYDLHEMHILYNPAQQFMPNSDLSVNVQLTDYVGNLRDTTYVISILEDNFSPYVVPVSPVPNSFSTTVNDTVKVDILDRGMGIDQSSIEFIINGREITNYQLLFNPYSYNPDSLGFQLSYSLNEEDFYEGQLVQVYIFAEDIAEPANYISEVYDFHMHREIDEKVEAIPNILTLNGDGYNDECRIWIDSTENASNIKAYLYSRNGKKIAKLQINDYSAVKKYAVWQGKDKNNNIVKAGMYIYKLVIGEKTYQGSIVVAR